MPILFAPSAAEPSAALSEALLLVPLEAQPVNAIVSAIAAPRNFAMCVFLMMFLLLFVKVPGK